MEGHPSAPVRAEPAESIAVAALTPEYLESTFYHKALRRVKFTNKRARKFAESTAQHEKAHVAAIRPTIEKLGASR
jgi:ferritin-like protein